MSEWNVVGERGRVHERLIECNANKVRDEWIRVSEWIVICFSTMWRDSVR